MRDPAIDDELLAANPWWQNPDTWSDTDVQLRAARKSPLQYEPQPLKGLRRGGLYILRGPRRVGKSTALKQLAVRRMEGGARPRSVLHVSVEGRDAQELEEIIRRGGSQWMSSEPGENLWLIDEITEVHGAWPATIKRLRDQHPLFAEDTVVLTGSSSARFDEAHKLLSGRRHASRSDRVLFQMSFGNVVAALGGSTLPPSPALSPDELVDADALANVIDDFRPWTEDLIGLWDQYLFVGGYPQAVAAAIEKDEESRGILTETLWGVIHGDAFAGADLTHTQTLTILRSLTTSLSSRLSVHRLAGDADMNDRTAESRLNALRRSFIAFPVHREQGLAPNARAQSKWYFTDPALSRLASDHGAGQPPDTTRLSEQQIAVALLRSLERKDASAAMHHTRLLYYQSSTRAEIDFVSPSFDGVCIESKFVDRAWGRAFQTIAASNSRTGIVATRSGLQRHDDGWAMPAGLLAYLIGA